ncbi:MAG: response regulator [Bacteroidales bacterium]|nr:response regulator [Bacteroidales bacterium]
METISKNIKQIKVLIVEDEPYAQKELKRLLENSRYDILVLECIDSVEDAINWINENPEPDMMFFDIQLADGLSFEIFKHIKSKAPIIFTTAFDEYAIQAFKVNSVDYLLKPIKQVELNAALDKFHSLIDSVKSNTAELKMEQIEKLLQLNKPKYKSRFIARVGDQIKHIGIHDIAYFKAESNEVFLVSNDNRRFIIDHALEQLNNLLDPDMFFRANRSYIVNVSSIKKISKYFNSRMHLELEPKTEEHVLISRVRVPDFLNWIDK